MSGEQIIYVPVQCADGIALVPHTPAEYRRFWEGVDREAAEVLSRELYPVPSCP